MKTIRQTELGYTMELLATLAQMGEDNKNFAMNTGKRLKKVWDESYTPKEDQELMKYMTPAEREELLTLA